MFSSCGCLWKIRINIKLEKLIVENGLLLNPQEGIENAREVIYMLVNIKIKVCLYKYICMNTLSLNIYAMHMYSNIQIYICSYIK